MEYDGAIIAPSRGTRIRFGATYMAAHDLHDKSRLDLVNS